MCRQSISEMKRQSKQKNSPPARTTRQGNGEATQPRARARKKKEEETLRGRVVVGGVFLGQCRLFRGRSLSMFARTSTSLFLLASVVSPFCFIHVGLSGPFLPLAHAATPEGHQEKKEKTKEEASSFPFFHPTSEEPAKIGNLPSFCSSSGPRKRRRPVGSLSLARGAHTQTLANPLFFHRQDRDDNTDRTHHNRRRRRRWQ